MTVAFRSFYKFVNRTFKNIGYFFKGGYFTSTQSGIKTFTLYSNFASKPFHSATSIF